MNDEQIFEKIINKEIAVSFPNIDSFMVFCGFLTTKGIYKKNPTKYYWDKYGQSLSVIISESGNFKCGTSDFYRKEGRSIYLYERKPYIVDII